MNRLKQLIGKIRPLLYAYWLRFTHTKFYTNKKILLPVCITLGLIILIILTGLIFGGKKGARVVKNTPSPTPTFTENVNESNSGTDALSQIERKLLDLKNQIYTLDVKQSRLQPPTLNFNIKF